MPTYTDPDELLTHVTDDDTIVLGPVARRRVHGNPLLIHRAVHVLVIHPGTGHLLLQKRSSLKDTHPGKWDTSVGGHVGFGQTYEETALRETEEELGLRVRPKQLEMLYTLRFRSEIESENSTTFLFLHAGPFEFNREEITEIKFWTRSEIEAGLGTGIFTPNFELEFATFIACPRGALLCG